MPRLLSRSSRPVNLAGSVNNLSWLPFLASEICFSHLICCFLVETIILICSWSVRGLPFGWITFSCLYQELSFKEEVLKPTNIKGRQLIKLWHYIYRIIHTTTALSLTLHSSTGWASVVYRCPFWFVDRARFFFFSLHFILISESYTVQYNFNSISHFNISVSSCLDIYSAISTLKM